MADAPGLGPGAARRVGSSPSIRTNDYGGLPMRTMVVLIRKALKARTARKSAKRLARLGGSNPQLTLPSRRQPTLCCE